jgi:fimbrial chaperone protein
MIPGMNGKGLHRTGRWASSPLFFLLEAGLLGLIVSPASAFSFEPITQEFAPSGSGSVQTFRLVNEAADSIAVRISMLSRQTDADGRESNEPADALFVVYPSRAVLGPGSVQAIRVQWKGPSNPKVEQCYRILVEQLPVDFGVQEKQKGGIRVLFRYLGAVYIVPPGARPDVVLESAQPATDAAGRPGLALVFANRGAAHAILNELSLTVASQGTNGREERTFGPQDLAGISGENLLPQTQRRFFLSLPDRPSVEGLDVSFSFEAIR